MKFLCWLVTVLLGVDAIIEHRAIAKQRVLVVIDVQNGYDAAFVDKATGIGPRGLGSPDWFMKEHRHSVSELVEKDSRAPLSNAEMTRIMKMLGGDQGARGDFHKFPRYIEEIRKQADSFEINYDKKWNHGLDAQAVRNMMTAYKELFKQHWDLVIFTYDYLDGTKPGDFPVPEDLTDWKIGTKPVLPIEFQEYLSIVYQNPEGVEIHNEFAALMGLKDFKCGDHYGNDQSRLSMTKTPKGREPWRVLCYRKQVDDAWADANYKWGMTGQEPATEHLKYTDRLDLDDKALPNPNMQTMATILEQNGFGPQHAELHFTGVVSDRCVSSSAVHATENGWTSYVHWAATAAESPEKQVEGEKKFQHYAVRALTPGVSGESLRNLAPRP